MSTRSTIGIIDSKGKEKRIYCHNDGYLRGVGKTLLEYWDTPEKINQLMKFGSISSLEKYPKVTVLDHPEGKRQHRYLMSVLSENDIDPLDVNGTYGGLEEYNYTWKNGEWWVEFEDSNGKDQKMLLEIAVLGFNGCKTSAPQRKKAAPKKRAPAVRVDFRKML